MVPRNAPKATLEESLFQVSKKAATGLRSNSNPLKMMPKFIKNPPKWRPGALQRHPKTDSENNSFPNIPPGVFFLDFWRHLGDFGRIFSPSWAPRGSKNRAFGRQGVPKAAKIASKKRSKKKLDFLIEFWSVIGRLGGPRSSFLVQFYNVSVVLAYYEEIKNFMENPCQNGAQKWSQIDVWAIRDPTFEALGTFLRGLILDEFSIGKKSA